MSFADDAALRKALREPFPREQISVLPRTDKRPALDYVGHAAVTDRLNSVAPGWTYELDPVIVEGNDGWPHVLAVRGSMTIEGTTRHEVGAVDSPSTYGQEMKEAISDFIRRGAMRFGVALDLWTKQDLTSGGSIASEYGEGSAKDPSELIGEGGGVEPATPSSPNLNPCRDAHVGPWSPNREDGSPLIPTPSGRKLLRCEACGTVLSDRQIDALKVRT